MTIQGKKNYILLLAKLLSKDVIRNQGFRCVCSFSIFLFLVGKKDCR